MESDSLTGNQPELPNPADPPNPTEPLNPVVPPSPAVSPNPVEPKWRFAPLRYRLIHFFYAMAMLAASFALFGAIGFLVALFVLGFWLIVFMVEPIRYGLAFAVFAVVATFLLMCLAACLTPAVMVASGPRQWSYCAINLKQLGLGLHNYHDSYGQLPPTYVTDQQGNRLHSWRTMILPYTEHSNVYKKYDLSQAWDGPTNSKLHKTRIPYQSCPDDLTDFPEETSYVAVCGEDATWSDQNALKLPEFSRGSSNTVLVIETHHSGIHWMEPRDISLEAAIGELSEQKFDTDDGHRSNGFIFQYSYQGHNVLLADGSVQFIPILSQDSARELLTGKLSLKDIHEPALRKETLRKVRYDNILKLVMFVLIALLPGYGVVVELTGKQNSRH
jgi:hypothetical protein